MIERAQDGVFYRFQRDTEDRLASLFERLRYRHIRDAMKDTGRAAGDVGKMIDKVRPPQ
jgi:hypothetical protein